MAHSGIDQARGDEYQVINKRGDYKVPKDIKEIQKKYSIFTKGFSAELLRVRSLKMNSENFDRAVKTIDCLRGDRFFK